MPLLALAQAPGAKAPGAVHRTNSNRRPETSCGSRYIMRVDPHGDLAFNKSNFGTSLIVNGVERERSAVINLEKDGSIAFSRLNHWYTAPRFHQGDRSSSPKLNGSKIKYEFYAPRVGSFSCGYLPNGKMRVIKHDSQKELGSIDIHLPRLKRVIAQGGPRIVVESEDTAGKQLISIVDLDSGTVLETGLGGHIGIRSGDYHEETQLLKDHPLSEEAKYEEMISEVAISEDGKYLAWIDNRSGLVGLMDILPGCSLAPPVSESPFDKIRERAIGQRYFSPQANFPEIIDMPLKAKADGKLDWDPKLKGSRLDVGAYLVLECADSNQPNSAFLGELFIAERHGKQNGGLEDSHAYFVAHRNQKASDRLTKYKQPFIDYSQGSDPEKKKVAEGVLTDYWRRSADALTALKAMSEKLKSVYPGDYTPLSKTRMRDLASSVPSFEKFFDENSEIYVFPFGFKEVLQSPTPHVSAMRESYTGGRGYLPSRGNDSQVLLSVAPIWLRENPTKPEDYDGMRVQLQFREGKGSFLDFGSTSTERFATRIGRTIWCVTPPTERRKVISR